jgi:hypothetical protein
MRKCVLSFPPLGEVGVVPLSPLALELIDLALSARAKENDFVLPSAVALRGLVSRDQGPKIRTATTAKP